jgi:formiminoglutamase
MMLTSPVLPAFPPDRPDDPRLNEVFALPTDIATSLRPGRPVLVGFPVDEGVRRNGGRVGAALAPDAIRAQLYRLTPTDAAARLDIRHLSPVDLGNVRVGSNLEESQEALAIVVSAILAAGAIPVVLGGGHETAFGHYLGYRRAGLNPKVVNLDAHLDVRPVVNGQGTSGTPFRQMMELPDQELQPGSYACLGVQPQATSWEHWEFCRQRGDVLATAESLRGGCRQHFESVCSRLLGQTDFLYVSVDADAVRAGDVPGVSAPNPLGLDGHELAACARSAGVNPGVASFELVEINPHYDLDDRSTRWAATMVWHFLMGLCMRFPA